MQRARLDMSTRPGLLAWLIRHRFEVLVIVWQFVALGCGIAAKTVAERYGAGVGGGKTALSVGLLAAWVLPAMILIWHGRRRGRGP